jgi:hypothetical protein
MIIRRSNRSSFSSFGSIQGTSLLECLIVVGIIAGLIAAVGSAFILTLRSYTGAYTTESLQLEGHRAAVELNYYLSAAKTAEVSDANLASNFTLPVAGNLSGTQLDLGLMDGVTTVSFYFYPNQSSTASLYRGSLIGTLRSPTKSWSYIYTTNALYSPTAGCNRPFSINSNGAVEFSWKLYTENGTAQMGGVTPIGL